MCEFLKVALRSGVAVVMSGLTLPAAAQDLSRPEPGECPASIEDIDMETYLDQRDGLDVEDCFGRTTEPPTLDFKYVQYGELDGEPGLEAVVRAQTCAMGTGGSDISEVLKLRCQAEGGWFLESIPVEDVAYGTGPGRPRYTPYLTVEGDHLEASEALYRPRDASVDPSWLRTVVYRFEDGGFKIESIAIKELEKRFPD